MSVECILSREAQQAKKAYNGTVRPSHCKGKVPDDLWSRPTRTHTRVRTGRICRTIPTDHGLEHCYSFNFFRGINK